MSKPRAGHSGKGVAVKLANKLKSKGKFHKSKPPVSKKSVKSKGAKRAFGPTTRRPQQKAGPVAAGSSGKPNSTKRKRASSTSGGDSSDDDNDPDLHSCEKKSRTGFHNHDDDDEEAGDIDLQPHAEDETAAPSDDVNSDVPVTPQLSLMELIAAKCRAVQECKSMVGNVCVAVISNPEKNLKKLKPILTLLDLRKEDPVFKLAFMQQQSLISYALLEVFKDILPAYRIKEDAAEDVVDKKLKKETRELREYESTLLKYYRTYISKLQRMTECVKKKKLSNFYDHALPNFAAKEKIAAVGTRCLCTLMLSHSAFNCGQEIIQTVVPLMSSRSAILRDLSFDHVVRLFREDKTGQISLQAVRSAGRVIKALKLNVNPLVIESFLHLRIKEARRADDSVDMNLIRQQNRKQSKMERKHNKELLKLKNELKETDAREDQEKKTATHTQILNQIFFVYFRFIKDFIELAESDFAKNAAVMTPVLEGLSKFAHLINIDFFDDLIALLYRLVVSQRMSHQQTLFALNTVFTILSGEGSAITIDPQRFYARFYSTLVHYNIENENETFANILIECFDKMLLKRKKQLTMARVLAFCKRMTSLSLQTSPETAAVYLSLLSSLLQDHPKADLLMDTEHYGSGSYQPLLEDPEFCNANATRLWELHLLSRHFDPYVSRLTRNHIQRANRSKVKADLIVKGANQVLAQITDHNRLENVFSDKSAAKIALVRRKHNASKRMCEDLVRSLSQKLVK
jgi:nucleolar complex protein 3